ncbi:MAG: hypothetical protein QOG96_3678, partial [Pseudonocardiales bacterium]|nr:hypothetical protein [Pseudonocardiales bacterium]
TGLDIAERAAYAEQLLFEVLGGKDRFAETDVRLLRFDHPDAGSNPEATAHLRITVKDPDPRKVGRVFSNATMELALGGYAGFHTTTPPSPEAAYGVYWPALVPSRFVTQTAVLPDGTERAIPHTHPHTHPRESGIPSGRVGNSVSPAVGAPGEALDFGPTERAPLGTLCAARSGDKGGNANVGLWTRTAEQYAWLRQHLTVATFRELLPEAAELVVQRHELPNLFALNFVVVGLLGEGVASSTRPDPQAKGLGEYLRSRLTDIPTGLIGAG